MGKWQNTGKHHIQENQEVSHFHAGDHMAAMNRHETQTTKRIHEKSIALKSCLNSNISYLGSKVNHNLWWLPVVIVFLGTCMYLESTMPLVFALIQTAFEPWHVISNKCGILTSGDSDEPVQPPFKLRNSRWCLVNSLALKEYSSD